MSAKVPHMCLLLLPTLLGFFRGSRSQHVIDPHLQDANYIDKYCPKTEHCAEGTHVMCMYYDERYPHGPRCANYKKINMTSQVRNRILEIVNAIRSKVALGKERTKKTQPLPRAYAMFRLKWDTELATFAQALADQCMLKHDLCRASSNFARPGQSLGIIRFSYPDWMPRVSGSKAAMIKPGFDEDKVWYALQGILKSWYEQKRFVTADMVANYPDFNAKQNKTGGRLFLEMMVPSATHMGCGMSGFTDITYKESHGDDYKISHNTIELVCNFSERPKRGQPVYPTQHPGGKDDTKRCGCPEGSREDQDCLCTLGLSPAPQDTDVVKLCASPDQNCEQTLVLLPIFTVEDAPAQKLITKETLERFGFHINNTSLRRRQNSMEIINFLEGASIDQHGISRLLNNAVILPPIHQSVSSQYSVNGTQNLELDNLFHDRIHKVPTEEHHYQLTKQAASNKKPSIFTKNAKFNLPQKINYGATKKDVEPRKDFSNAEQIVNSYLSKWRHGDKTFNQNEHRPGHYEHFDSFFDATTEVTLNNAEEKVINYNHNLQDEPDNLIVYQHGNANRTNEGDENKILALLDTLEREVKHIELDRDKKEIFDEKIRKIYGAILNKQPDLLTTQHNSDTHFNGRRLSNFEHYAPTHLGDRIGERRREIFENQNDLHDTNKIDIPYEILNSGLGKPLDNNGRYFRHNSDEDYKHRNYDNVSQLKHTNKVNEAIDHRGKDRSHYLHGYDKIMYPISNERRYYQEKLRGLERRVHDTRSYRHRNMHGAHTPPHMRRMRPTRDEPSRTSAPKSQIDEFYMPDRARYLHGFR